MDCPPVSPGGERGHRGSPGTGRGGGAHREPVVKVGSAPGARPGRGEAGRRGSGVGSWRGWGAVPVVLRGSPLRLGRHREHGRGGAARGGGRLLAGLGEGFPVDRKSTRLNSSHQATSYAVFCLKKKNYRHGRNDGESGDDRGRRGIANS